MSVKEKLTHNPHTMELVGGSSGFFSKDIIQTEFDAMTDEDSILKPELAEEYIIFCIQSWDHRGEKVKQVVARFAVGKDMKADYLIHKIHEVIKGVYAFGFIVNNVTGDGATQNRSSFKALGTICAGDLFKPTSLSKPLPNRNLPVAFPHPCDKSIKVFIGGEMPHLVKKFANAFYRSSSSKKKTALVFRGQKMNLNMIENVWRADFMGTNSLRNVKLTDDHFDRNAYSAMRVHLAVQIFSDGVACMLEDHIEFIDEATKTLYEPLIAIIRNVDKLIDIWNARSDKKCGMIDCPNHSHITELREILDIFEEWRNESKENGGVYSFIPNESWEDLCWLVYGIEGVATTYLKDNKSLVMHQKNGGSDVCEHNFADTRARNQNPDTQSTNSILGRRAGLRAQMNGNEFNLRPKSNSGRGDKPDLGALCAAIHHKRTDRSKK